VSAARVGDSAPTITTLDAATGRHGLRSTGRGTTRVAHNFELDSAVHDHHTHDDRGGRDNGQAVDDDGGTDDHRDRAKWIDSRVDARPGWSADPCGVLLRWPRPSSYLRQYAPIQNQHIMGFGTVNPEPSPGKFDWSSLDGRVALMRKTGATPVITLCCAPDWMKGGAAGADRLEPYRGAPTRAQFPAFAQLSAEWQSAIQTSSTFQVWNELKGFYDASHNRWDYEAYNGSLQPSL